MAQTKQQKRTALITAIKKSKLLNSIHGLESLYGKPYQIKSIVSGKLANIAYHDDVIDTDLKIQVTLSATGGKAQLSAADSAKAANALFDVIASTIYSDILHYALKQFDPLDPVQVALVNTFIGKGAAKKHYAMVSIGWFKKGAGRFLIAKV
ncbi:MAG: hypothetical protein H9535_19285 [Ignavibacteria bacterium]|nr:hypothetical protein [Ignavibacteria bacterium]